MVHEEIHAEISQSELGEIFEVDTRTVRIWEVKRLLVYCQSSDGERYYGRSSIEQLFGDLPIQPTITVFAAAKVLGIDRWRIERWMDQGILHTIKTPGGRRQVLRSEVDKLRQDNAHIRSRREGVQHLSSPEMAQLLRVKRISLQRWANAGLIGANRLYGGYWQFPISSLNALFRESYGNQPLPDLGEVFLTARELAPILGLSINQFYNATDPLQIQPLRLPHGHMRFRGIHANEAVLRLNMAEPDNAQALLHFSETAYCQLFNISLGVVLELVQAGKITTFNVTGTPYPVSSRLREWLIEFKRSQQTT